MKSVIPFTKELEFNTKVSEITSISLERDFSLQKDSIEGNLYVTGEYKSHEISVNVVPFSFKIPFSIALSKKIKEESISLEISDFAYDMLEENKIKVHIELELSFENEEEQEENEENDESLLDESESIITMMEERNKEEQNEELDQIVQEPQEELKEREERREEEPVPPEEKTIPNEEERNEDTMKQETDVILGTETKEEYMTYHIHIMKEGETLETLCAMYHVTGSYLAEYNDISNISLGDKILIPLENE